jgi:hypothetical protein
MHIPDVDPDPGEPNQCGFGPTTLGVCIISVSPLIMKEKIL